MPVPRHFATLLVTALINFIDSTIASRRGTIYVAQTTDDHDLDAFHETPSHAPYLDEPSEELAPHAYSSSETTTMPKFRKVPSTQFIAALGDLLKHHLRVAIGQN